MATAIFPIISTCLLLLLLLLLLPSSPASAADPEHEKLTLLRLKSYWKSPSSLSSWANTSTTAHCSWLGVSCTSGHVTNLTLHDRGIDVGVPPFVCDLANLTVLDLFNNSVRYPLPTFLSNCTNLLHLNLGKNCLNGSLPSDIHAKLPTGLLTLNLGGNKIAGEIPTAIGKLTALRSLYLERNYFSSFQPEIGNLVNLETLTLAVNPLHPAPLPPEFAALKKLNYLWISSANLTGGLPDWLGSLQLLEYLQLSRNSLTGTIPDSIWGLKNLKFMYLYGNNLHGSIPASIGALGLKGIDVSENKLNGSIPDDFSKLQNLTILFMYNNSLSGPIPAGISRMPSLYDIRLFENRLTGPLPPDLGKYSPLWNLEVTKNQLSGELPDTLCAKDKLAYIALYNNSFTGRIPDSLANCTSLTMFRFQQNRFSGDVPAGLWKLPELQILLLHDNELSGELPEELTSTLTRLEVQNNRFSGRMPRSARQLLVFHAGSNAFSGELPGEFSGFATLQELLLGGNMISGAIPASIGVLKKLTTLTLSQNQLTGAIPESIGSLQVLNYLDLSSNHLSGEIPGSFDNLKLNSLNLSSNSLTGPIPSSLRVGAYDRSFLSNPGLCSGETSLFGLAACTGGSGEGSAGLSGGLLVLVVVLGTVVVLAVTAFGFFALRDLRRRRRQPWDNTKWKLTPFQYVDFTESDIVRRLAPENLVGSGGAGEVYRVPVGGRGGEVVAVKRILNSKKLDSRLQKEFLAEVQILGNVRHANIVKLLCCISSDDCKMLVYEYLENGSLYSWVHGKGRDRSRLDWPTRVEIAVGAARGLCYMHHDCNPPIAHWDVKSSNILLDADFKSKVADFGLARILANGIGEPNSVSTVAGSFGYMAPECTCSKKVNEKVDVYSFGVVLLELTTGKQAHEGGRDRSLVDWTWACFRQEGSVVDVVDGDIKNPLWMEEIEVVTRLGLLCTTSLPSSRPTMKDVLNVLLRCASMHGAPNDREARKSNSGPLLQKVGWRSRRVKDDEVESKEDRLVLLGCNL